MRHSFPRLSTHRGELWLTRLMIAVTLVATFFFGSETLQVIVNSWQLGHFGNVALYVGIVLALFVPIYGNLVYQFSRLGYFRRLALHRPATVTQLDDFAYGPDVPQLTILVPSYKEEQRIISQTVLSAALQEYPHRRVVLLVDDPHNSPDVADQRHLAATRQLIADLDARFAEPAGRFAAARDSYLSRRHGGRVTRQRETQRLAECYEYAAEWLTACMRTFSPDDFPSDHTDRFFIRQILAAPRTDHLRRAAKLRSLSVHGEPLTERRIAREYTRLINLFKVEITAFERKQYENLSHELNKAMNLNSYIALIGKSWRKQRTAQGLFLTATAEAEADFVVPNADYVLTLDADSLLLPDYALRLVRFMEQPEHATTGVVQTPYSAIPGAKHPIERIAGATTDIQFLVHQGFTQYNATFWVGANALLRKTALDDIRVTERERGHEIARYIQDRTVIEDTESTIDLADRGWQLYNYPARLAYSATPGDFGAFLIQRRRWANGGLIIFPKLFRYLLRRASIKQFAEGALRTHYLLSIGGVSFGMLALLALPSQAMVLNLWLPLTTMPYFFLYGRDLVRFGYRATDLFRVYSLNLLLVPINIGGVLKSVQQALTGAKIPFGRTPKVEDRTAAPATYILAEYSLCGFLLYAATTEALAGRWILSAIASANFLLFASGLLRFIGLRASIEDLFFPARQKLSRYPFVFRPEVPTLATTSLDTEDQRVRRWRVWHFPRPARTHLPELTAAMFPLADTARDTVLATAQEHAAEHARYWTSAGPLRPQGDTFASVAAVRSAVMEQPELRSLPQQVSTTHTQSRVA